MSCNKTKQLLKLFQPILDDYACSCDVDAFDGEIVIAEDMSQMYLSLRRIKADECTVKIDDIHKYHGLTVQPADKDERFTILLNENYINDSIEKGNNEWIRTLVHEATHVNDFKDYYKIVSPESYDELYEYSRHRAFLHWTEFHARAIGHYFLRKYSLQNFKSITHVQRIFDVELPFHIQRLVEKLNSTSDADAQLYDVSHFLGRLAVWQFLYPSVFNNSFICELTNSNPWMKELYFWLTQYKTLEEIQPHFSEFEAILDKHFL